MNPISLDWSLLGLLLINEKDILRVFRYKVHKWKCNRGYAKENFH